MRPVVDTAAVQEIAERLAAAGVPSPEVDARLLLEHVGDVTGDTGGRLLEDLVARRVAREPLQHLLGRTWFRTLELTVAPGVFVPRPETEVVAGLAIAAARTAGGHPRVVEPCTGSGAIACALLAEVPGVEVVATDIDPAAVDLAATNLARTSAGIADPDGPAPGARGEVRSGDLLDPVPADWRGRVDVLVSNPPYLPLADLDTWAPEVTGRDPQRALIGGPDGLEVVVALLDLATIWLRAGGSVIVEIDDRRGPDALDAAAAAGLVSPRLVPDLTGRDRAIVAQRPGSVPGAPSPTDEDARR